MLGPPERVNHGAQPSTRSGLAAEGRLGQSGTTITHGYFDSKREREGMKRKLEKRVEDAENESRSVQRRRAKSEQGAPPVALRSAAAAASSEADRIRNESGTAVRSRTRSAGSEFFSSRPGHSQLWGSQHDSDGDPDIETEAREAAVEQQAREEAEQASRRAAGQVDSVIDLCDDDDASLKNTTPRSGSSSSFEIPDPFSVRKRPRSPVPQETAKTGAEKLGDAWRDDQTQMPKPKETILNKKPENDPDFIGGRDGQKTPATFGRVPRRSGRTESRVIDRETPTIVDDFLNDDENGKRQNVQVEKEDDGDFPKDDPDTVYFQYPRKDPDRKSKGAIVVTAADFARLRPNQYLNDTIIDLFFKEYQDLAESRRPNEMHFFSSFFYRRLFRQAKSIDYDGVKSWTKDIDIFSKKIVLIPICDLSHWSLAVVVNPGSLQTWQRGDSIVQSPALVYFDSLNSIHKKNHLRNIKDYLTAEWKFRKPGRESLNLKSLREYNPKVPKQSNDFDCGLYCLMYARKCISDLHFASGKSLGFCSTWFTEFDIWAERQVIRADFEHRRDYETQLSLIPDGREAFEGGS